MGKVFLAAAGLLLATGCLTRAPTSYELDRRAGFTPPTTAAEKDNVEKLQRLYTSSAVPRAPRMPVKVPPLIEKVWVADQVLGDGAVLQGTWIYLEVVGGRWLNEVDPGGAPLIDLDWRQRAARGPEPAGVRALSPPPPPPPATVAPAAMPTPTATPAALGSESSGS